MTSPTKNQDEIVENLLGYLASRGHPTSRLNRVELLALVRGHASGAAEVQHAQECTQFFVLDVALADKGVGGMDYQPTLAHFPKTLAGVKLQFSTREDALTFARRRADEKLHPVVVCNGAFEVIEVCDEFIRPDGGYIIVKSAGALRNMDAACADTELADEIVLVDDLCLNLRFTVAIAQNYAEGTEDNLFVVSGADRRIAWRELARNRVQVVPAEENVRALPPEQRTY